jgi:hypothetical protein
METSGLSLLKTSTLAPGTNLGGSRRRNCSKCCVLLSYLQVLLKIRRCRCRSSRTSHWASSLLLKRSLQAGTAQLPPRRSHSDLGQRRANVVYKSFNCVTVSQLYQMLLRQRACVRPWGRLCGSQACSRHPQPRLPYQASSRRRASY